MISKTFTYMDYNGNDRTETCYFNLNETEIIELESSAEGGLSVQLEDLTKSNDNKKLFETFKSIILKSYGEKSPDGRRFIKSKELTDAFEQSIPFSMLFMELAVDANAASSFINGIIPKNLQDRLPKDVTKNAGALPEIPQNMSSTPNS